MSVKNLLVGGVFAVSAFFSACSFETNQPSETLAVNQQNSAAGIGSYVVVKCDIPGSSLVDRAGNEVRTPVLLTVKSDKQTISSFSLKATIPAHVNLEDSNRTSIGERLVEFSDVRVVSGIVEDTRSGQGVKYALADNQKVAVTKSGQKKISNLKSLKISESKGADYLSIRMELAGASNEAEVVLLSACDVQNRALLSKFPK